MQEWFVENLLGVITLIGTAFLGISGFIWRILSRLKAVETEVKYLKETKDKQVERFETAFKELRQEIKDDKEEASKERADLKNTQTEILTKVNLILEGKIKESE